MRPPITGSPYFLVLFTNRFYLVPKCTLFDTTSLKMGTKKEGVFQPSLNFTVIIFQFRNILFLTKILLVNLIYHQQQQLFSHITPSFLITK